MRSWVIFGSVCILLITGCSGGKPTVENYEKIKADMPISEVESILGKADSKLDNAGQDMRIWNIPGNEKGIMIMFKDGKVQMKDLHK